MHETVHTCASHEKMFISYMDIQTCMARKTPSLHVHRMGGVTKWAQGPGTPSLCLTLSRLHPRPQFLLDNGVGMPPSREASLPTLTFGSSLAALAESSGTELGARERVSSVGRSPPGTPGWAAALLASRPWTSSAYHPAGPF